MTMSNQKRATRCERVLSAYSDDDAFTNLTDLLADAMHWADATGQDFHYALCLAGKHYVAELNDEQLDERRLP
jgi:hypothetical protein